MGIRVIRVHHSELAGGLSGAIAKIREIAGNGDWQAGKTANIG